MGDLETRALLADARTHLTNGTGCPSCVEGIETLAAEVERLHEYADHTSCVEAFTGLLNERNALRTEAATLREVVQRVRELPDDFRSEVDWSSGRSNYGDNAAWENAADRLTAALGDATEETP